MLTVLLTLGLGAGLTAGELLGCTAAQVRRHPARGLTVIRLADRTVPVRAAYAEGLAGLCRARPDGPLIGDWRPGTKDPLGRLRQGVEIPSYLPALTIRRLRTTWMTHVLAGDVRISEFQAVAGTVSAKTLEALAPFVPGRWANHEYLSNAAGPAVSGSVVSDPEAAGS